MVGPVSENARDAFRRKLKVALVALVGLSGGLITLQGDVGVVGFVVATLVGSVVGAALVWLVFPSGLAEFR